MTKQVAHANVDRHVESLEACHPDGRAEGASKIATDEASAAQALEGRMVGSEFPHDQRVPDRPGTAALVAQGQVIAEFELRRRQGRNGHNEDIQYS